MRAATVTTLIDTGCVWLQMNCRYFDAVFYLKDYASIVTLTNNKNKYLFIRADGQTEKRMIL